jgi:hypothetical protein
MCVWRTLAGRKPYLLLMNTDYDRFTPDLVERYFQRSLFYGMFPSMFSHNAAENPYWRNPAWYNRDRPLFKKYIPLIKRAAEAGWQPVTGARCDNAKLWLERFGPTEKGAVYFTVLNIASTPQTGVLRIEPGEVPVRSPSVATELTANRRLAEVDGGWELEVPAEGVALVGVEPGAKFVQVEAASPGTLRFTIESSPGLEPVLEASGDLRDWLAVETELPELASFEIEVLATPLPQRFFRLRW